MDGLHYAKAGNRTVRSVCPHTSYRYGTPTCNACSHQSGFLLIPGSEFHLPEAHDSHKASDADNHLASKEVDVLLLGPQVRFMKADFEKRLEPKGIPLDIINMADYGLMNGEKVLQQALRLIESK